MIRYEIILKKRQVEFFCNNQTVQLSTLTIWSLQNILNQLLHNIVQLSIIAQQYRQG